MSGWNAPAIAGYAQADGSMVAPTADVPVAVRAASCRGKPPCGAGSMAAGTAMTAMRMHLAMMKTSSGCWSASITASMSRFNSDYTADAITGRIGIKF